MGQFEKKGIRDGSSNGPGPKEEKRGVRYFSSNGPIMHGDMRNYMHPPEGEEYGGGTYGTSDAGPSSSNVQPPYELSDFARWSMRRYGIADNSTTPIPGLANVSERRSLLPIKRKDEKGLLPGCIHAHRLAKRFGINGKTFRGYYV